MPFSSMLPLLLVRLRNMSKIVQATWKAKRMIILVPHCGSPDGRSLVGRDERAPVNRRRNQQARLE